MCYTTHWIGCSVLQHLAPCNTLKRHGIQSHPAASQPSLPYPTLPYPTLPYHTIPYLILPYLPSPLHSSHVSRMPPTQTCTQRATPSGSTLQFPTHTTLPWLNSRNRGSRFLLFGYSLTSSISRNRIAYLIQVSD